MTVPGPWVSRYPARGARGRLIALDADSWPTWSGTPVISCAQRSRAPMAARPSDQPIVESQLAVTGPQVFGAHGGLAPLANH